MSFKTTLLLLLLLGLVAAGYFFTRPSHVDPSRMDEPLLPEVVWQDVDAIKVVSLGRTTEYLFVRKPDGTFWMAEPVKDLASAAFLNSLHDVYGAARRRLYRKKAEITEKDLKDTGLVEPRASAEFRSQDRSARVDVGEEDPAAPGIFVRIGGDIYTSTSALYSATQINQDEARERSFFRASPQDLQALAITRDVNGTKETLRFERIGAQEFGLAAPVKARANAQVTSGLIATVLGMRATYFASSRPREPATLGLDPPRYHIEVETHAGKETADLGSLREGGGGVHAFLPGRDIFVAVEGRDLTAFLEAPLEQFRSRYLFPCPAALAQRLRIDSGSASLTLQRKDAGGHDLLAPVKRSTDPKEVGALLEALDGLHVVEFVGEGPPPAESGLAGEVLKIEMTPEGTGKRPVVVRLGAAASRQGADVVFARRDDESWTVLVAAQPLARLKLHWTTYVEKKLLERPLLPADVERVEVAAGGKLRRTYRRTGSSWTEEPGGRDAPLFAEHFEKLSDLRVQALVPGLAGEVLRDRTPDMVLTFIRPDLSGPEATLHQMEFYVRGDETWVRLANQVLVFVLKKLDAGTLLALKD